MMFTDILVTSSSSWIGCSCRIVITARMLAFFLNSLVEYLLTAITVLLWPVLCGEGLAVPCFRTRELFDIWAWFLRKDQ